MKLRGSGTFPEHRYPADPWRLVEAEPDLANLGVTETLFAVGNGYIGMRANPSEGRDAHSHGTYLNGFHETWPIHHAESAVAFAKTGQTIVNAPDAKLMKLYVDDEPLRVGQADLDSYERVIDFAAGRSWRELIWRTPSGKLIRIFSSRMVSMVHRHLAVLTLEIELLDGEAPIVVSSQLLNRQDGEDEYHVRAAALGEGRDPRRARKFAHRVLTPRLARTDPDANGAVLGYRCTNSGMTIACGYHHLVDTSCDYEVETTASEDIAKTVITARAVPNQPIRITKLVSYHSSRGVPAEELADRCGRTLRRARSEGLTAIVTEGFAPVERPQPELAFFVARGQQIALVVKVESDDPALVTFEHGHLARLNLGEDLRGQHQVGLGGPDQLAQEGPDGGRPSLGVQGQAVPDGLGRAGRYAGIERI